MNQIQANKNFYEKHCNNCALRLSNCKKRKTLWNSIIGKEIKEQPELYCKGKIEAKWE